jgi:hypothetical protein
LNLRHATFVVVAGLIDVAVAGCLPTPQIERYRVPKQHVIDKFTGADKAGKDRTLAAIIPRGHQNWFFKLSGQSDLVAEQIEDFSKLVKSLRFDDQGKPKWSLPKGWSEQGGEGMRFATLQVETDDGPLETTVISLPRPEHGDDASYVLSNVNRWRSQLGLPEMDQAELGHAATNIELDDATALLVNFEGRLKAGGMGPPGATGPAPFVSGAEARQPGVRSGVATGSANEAGEPTYLVPAGWKALGAGAMRKAGFQVTDGGQKAEITISTAGGELLANVNRWRGQVMLEPIDGDQLQDAAQHIELGDAGGAYFQLVGPQRTILGVVARVRGQFWFVKLAGDNELAEHERERFEQFVKSIHFSGAEGADHGQ